MGVEKEEKIVVGLNKYRDNDFSRIETLKVNPEVEEKQIEGLKMVRDERDKEMVKIHFS